MSAFEIVTVAVALSAIVIAVISYLRTGRVIDQLGRRGSSWFDRHDDIAVADRPNEDDRDEPIPRRPMRGWPH